MAQLDDITTKVTKLEGKVNSIENMSGKLDTAIEKLTDVSTSIKTMLAVHEEKINRGGEIDDELFSQIEMRRRELSKDIKEVHSRLNTTSKELRQCINNLSNQIRQQERFKWLLIGGATVLGYFISNSGMFDRWF